MSRRHWIEATAVGAILAPFLYAEFRLRLLETLNHLIDAPSGAHVRVDGLDIHYESLGEGDVVVLIHGFGGSTYSWRENIQAIAAGGHRVYAIDLPGFGYSERTSRPVFMPSAWAKVVAGFLSRAGAIEGRCKSDEDPPPNPAVIVGNSLGASVALRFAVDYPQLTRALVLTAPAVYSRRFWGRHLRVLGVPVVGHLLARSMYYYLLASHRGTARIIASAYGRRVAEVTDEMRESMLRPIRVRGSADAAYGLFRSREEKPLIELLSTITVPILILAGGHDQAVPLESVERLHTVLRTSKLVILDGAGHLVQEDEPAEFNRLVNEFIGSLEPADCH